MRFIYILFRILSVIVKVDNCMYVCYLKKIFFEYCIDNSFVIFKFYFVDILFIDMGV